MNAGHTVSTTASEKHVEVKLGDVVLADTKHPVLLEETGLPTRFYVPREDVRMEFLEPTTFHTTCPFKGEASYWSATIEGERHDGLVWSYEEPLPGAAEIKDLMCFYPDRVETKVDGEPIAA